MMKPEDGPSLTLWDVSATALWLISIGLLVVDLFIDDEGIGRVGEVGVYVLAAAVTVTIRCISQRHLEAMSNQMRSVFELGRDSRSIQSVRTRDTH